MKTWVKMAVGALILAGVVVACATVERPAVTEDGVVGRFDDGRYRGIYEDRGEQQVSIQFHLEDNVIHDVSYRHLYHSAIDYRDDHTDDRIRAIVEQHDAIARSLEGRSLEAMFELYNPGEMIGDEYDVDGATAATLRGNKIFSAMMDGLNRGLYTPANDFSREIADYQDGRYRGIYGDRGEQQVSIQFHLEDGMLRDLSYRYLYHSGIDYRDDHDDGRIQAIVQQHDAILDYLEGRSLEYMFELHSPGDVIGDAYDVDGATGATVRANKVLSAMMDGLNRGIYVPPNGFDRVLPQYTDGRYRGIYGDRGDQQVSVQFHVEDGLIRDVSYRHLYHAGIDYRDEHTDERILAIVAQHEAIGDYLDGKPVEAIYDLHFPGTVIDPQYDVDGATGATVRANKVFSAMMDGLNRGVY